MRVLEAGTACRGQQHLLPSLLWSLPAPGEELLTNAVSSILAQDYTGDIEVICVYDQSTPNREHVIDDPHRTVRVLPNTRRGGLAGARNTGILAATGDLIALR